jgi:hypothetical protein
MDDVEGNIWCVASVVHSPTSALSACSEAWVASVVFSLLAAPSVVDGSADDDSSKARDSDTSLS